MSRSLTSVGPNATLIDGDLATAIRRLKADLPGTFEIGGPDLARPFFAGPRPPLRLTGADRIGGDVIRLTYVPAAPEPD